eukprot:7387348-Prymnesium_polylepis.5
MQRAQRDSARLHGRGRGPSYAPDKSRSGTAGEVHARAGLLRQGVGNERSVTVLQPTGLV